MLFELGELSVRAEGDYWVADSAEVIGNVVLGDGASVWFHTVIRGDNEAIVIGKVLCVHGWVFTCLNTPGMLKRFSAAVKCRSKASEQTSGFFVMAQLPPLTNSRRTQVIEPALSH